MTQSITLSNGKQVYLPRLPELKSLDVKDHQPNAVSPPPRPEGLPISPPDKELWARLDAMILDDPKAAKPISARLAQEHNWTSEQTKAAIAEYKRFLYLAVTAGHPVTPSRPVDLVWHEHLIHTRHYWDVLCKDVLRQTFHHDPGDGSTTDGERLQAQYRQTLDSYRTAFGDDPPTDIWPRPVTRTKSNASAGGTMCFFGLFGSVAGIAVKAPALTVIGAMLLVFGFVVMMTRSASGTNNNTSVTGGCGAGCGGGGIGGTGCADGGSCGDSGGSGGDGGASCGGGGCGGGGD